MDKGKARAVRARENSFSWTMPAEEMNFADCL